MNSAARVVVGMPRSRTPWRVLSSQGSNTSASPAALASPASSLLLRLHLRLLPPPRLLWQPHRGRTSNARPQHPASQGCGCAVPHRVPAQHEVLTRPQPAPSLSNVRSLPRLLFPSRPHPHHRQKRCTHPRRPASQRSGCARAGTPCSPAASALGQGGGAGRSCGQQQRSGRAHSGAVVSSQAPRTAGLHPAGDCPAPPCRPNRQPARTWQVSLQRAPHLLPST